MKWKSKLKFAVVFVLVALLFCASGANAGTTTYFVKPMGTGDGTGGWGTASNDVRSILDKAVANDIIYVASGDYSPGSNADDTFNLKAGVKLYGGFNPENTGTASGDRDVAKYTTILNGNNAPRTVAVVTGGTGATTSDTRLDGFVITGGNNSSAATIYGGGMFNATSSPTVTNCTFVGNRANYGGGMFNNGSPAVTNCTFSGNTANFSGGGMANLFAATIINCTFSGNTAASSGGGMFNDSGSSSTIANTIFWDNTATSGGTAIEHVNTGTTTLKNCVVPTGEVVGSGGGMITSSDMVWTDPKIVSVDVHGRAQRLLYVDSFGNPVYLLKSTDVYIYKISDDTSSAIDKGLAVGTVGTFVPATDQLGKARPAAPAPVTIGSFEYRTTPPTPPTPTPPIPTPPTPTSSGCNAAVSTPLWWLLMGVPLVFVRKRK